MYLYTVFCVNLCFPFSFFISSFHELMQSCGVRPSVCLYVRPSVNFAQIVSSTKQWLDRDQTCTQWSPDGPASRVCSRSRSRSNVIAHMVKQFVKLFAIQYGLTFCLCMRSLYEPPLHSPSSISIRQLDLMSKSWNELLRH